MRWIWLMVMLVITGPAMARPIIADLSLRKIEIDSGFTGTEILLFGARNDAGDIVVVIRGPETSYTVRKKERVAGVWVNRKQLQFHGLNGFYAVASNRGIDEIHNSLLLQKLGIGLDLLQPKAHRPSTLEEEEEFAQALIDHNVEQKLYAPDVENVSFIGDTLFRTILHFPDNIPRGTYTAEVYLFSGGQLSGMQSIPLLVYKKGFDAWVYDFAHSYSALYGLLCIALALIAGWGAGRVFRKV